MGNGLRTKWAIGLVVVLVAVGGYYGLEQFKQRQFATHSEVYEDSENKFSFRYPEDWKLIPKKDLELRNPKFVTGAARVGSPDVAVGVIVEKSNTVYVYERETFVKVLENNLSKLDQYEKLKLKDAQVSGYSAVDITYAYKPENRALVKQRQLLVVTPTTLYYLSGNAAKGEPSEYWEQITQIFQSFQILE